MQRQWHDVQSFAKVTKLCIVAVQMTPRGLPPSPPDYSVLRVVVYSGAPNAGSFLAPFSMFFFPKETRKEEPKKIPLCFQAGGDMERAGWGSEIGDVAGGVILRSREA